MKCVKLLGNASEVVRITDEKAANLVRDGKAKYCPKHEWKAQAPASRGDSESPTPSPLHHKEGAR